MTKLTNTSYLKLHTNESLKALLVDVMNEYARRFCEMYDYAEGWWVADDPCGTYCTDGIEVSISASDVVFCVDNDIDGDTFSHWWEYVLNFDNPAINLRSWCIGARPGMTEGGEV